MKIGIDARVLEKPTTGISKYLYSLLKGIPEIDNKNEYVLFTVDKLIGNSTNYENVYSGTSKKDDKFYSPYWLNFILPGMVSKNRIDILFSPNQLLPFQKLNCKSVITVHDVFHKIDKRFHPLVYRKYLDLQLPISLKRASKIITISEAAKNDILKYYNFNAEKISVIYQAADNSFKPLQISTDETAILKKKYCLPQRFVLYVGKIEFRKNILEILKISKLVASKAPDMKFVLIGSPGHGFKEINHEIENNKNVIYLNHIDDETVIKLYNMAHMFIFPSSYEGFGLPPLEAMQCGLPVLCSDIPPHREVVGDAGVLLSPEDTEGFSCTILNLLENAAIYTEMKSKSIERAKLFTNKQRVKKTVALFNSV